MAMPPFIIPVMAGLVQAAPAGWQFVAAAQGNTNGGGAITLGPINTTGADLIIVGATSATGYTVTLTDSQGNTWLSTAQTNAFIFYAYNAITGPSHTFQVSGTFYNAFSVAAYSGSLTSANPLDQSANNNLQGNVSPSITPTQDNELVFAVFSIQSNDDPSTLSNGFTVRNNVVFVNGNNFGLTTGDVFQTTAAAISTQINQSTVYGSTIASFKGA